jgi:dipeptidyl aminopeptidase/acylaminoacyl peptidase
MIRLPRAFFLIPLLCLFCGALSAQSSDSMISAGDMLKLKQLASPALSPDGSRVVYAVRSIEEKSGQAGEYTYRTQLWIVSLDGIGGARQLTRGESSSAFPVWHPRGDRIAFVRSDKDGPQIWVLPLAPGAEAFRVTQIPTGATHPRWSPDGAQLLFTSALSLAEVRQELAGLPANRRPAMDWPGERPGRKTSDTPAAIAANDKQPGALPSAADAERRWLARHEAAGNPRVLTRLEFIGDSDLEPEEQFIHLYVARAEKDAPAQLLTPGYVSAEGSEWANLSDGPRVIFSAESPGAIHPDRVLERALWSVGLDGSTPQLLLNTPNFTYTRPTASPDARTIAFLAEDLSLSSYGQTQLGVIAADGSARKILTTKLDRSASRPKWSADGKYVYFTAPTNGGHPLFRVRANGTAEPERLTGVSDGIRAYDLGSTYGVVVLTQATNPFELHRVNLATKEFRLLTSHNSEWLRTKSLASPQRRQLENADGTKLDSWLIKPSYMEPGKKYPLIVAIHGGPQAMWGPGDATMWHEFQFFAARGYGILYCNPRGSGGYGYEFQRAGFQNWGPGPSSDVLAATDLACTEPWVDKDRLVLSGGSYGGYLVAWIVGHDKRFKAAVAQRGIYDLATFFGEGSAWRLVPYHFGGYPWQPSIRRLLDAQSPLSHAENIVTPLLIEHGDNDRRTGTAQSEMLFRALKVLQRPVEYVRYPYATHELSRSGDPAQRIDRLLRFDEFFRRFVGE